MFNFKLSNKIKFPLFGSLGLIVLYFIYLIYKTIKNKNEQITVSDIPTSAQLFSSLYIFPDSYIKQYCNDIITATDRFGTDEKLLHEISQKLWYTNPTNTLNLFNEYKSRKLQYSKLLSQFVKYDPFFGDEISLKQLLRFELNSNEQEKIVLKEWEDLFNRVNL